MIKDTFKPVRKELDTGSIVSIVPSIGDSIDSLVFRYSNADVDLVMHFSSEYGERLLNIFNSGDVQKLVEKAIYYSNQAE